MCPLKLGTTCLNIGERKSTMSIRQCACMAASSRCSGTFFLDRERGECACVARDSPGGVSQNCTAVPTKGGELYQVSTQKKLDMARARKTTYLVISAFT